MVHWQIQLTDWRLGQIRWHGTPYRDMIKTMPGMWKDKVDPYKYSTLEEAQLAARMFRDSAKTPYQIKIFKITSKSKRKR